MKNVLYLFNFNKDSNFSVSLSLVNHLKTKNAKVYVENEEFAKIANLEVIDEKHLNSVDFMIVLGGDGTLFRNAKNYASYEFPILGINMGRVGALTQTELHDFERVVDKALNDDYTVEHNLALTGTIYKGDEKIREFLIFNDVNVHRGSLINPIAIELAVNNSICSKMYADGMLVATPVGSTAYNLSAGGPLLSHRSKCYVATPIASQCRSFTSLVVNENDVMTIRVCDSVGEVYVYLDGAIRYPLEKDEYIEIKKSECCLNLIIVNKDDSLYDAMYRRMSSK